MIWLIGVYLVLVIALPLALSALVSYRTLPRGVTCPLCRGETFAVCARWLRWASRMVRRGTLVRRWCPACRWEGVVRQQVLPGAPRVRPPRREPRPER
ncbi:MAG: hypothetical protein HY561_00275 [Gemmatimonadetes bacterium]|nr:hypothetical protein [Gemmatimonadota bacterium]